MNDFNEPERASTLWAMAKTGAVMPGIFEALGAKAAEMVKGFNAQEIDSTLRAKAETGADMPDVFEALSEGRPRNEGLQRARASQYALGHGHDRCRHACDACEVLCAQAAEEVKGLRRAGACRCALGHGQDWGQRA